MNLLSEIENTHNEILKGYELEALKMPKTDPKYTDYMKFVESFMALLNRRTVRYKTIAEELHNQLIITGNIKKVFKKNYIKLDKLVNKTIKEVVRNIPRNETKLKEGLICGIKKEHLCYLNCFINYESEVILSGSL